MNRKTFAVTGGVLLVCMMAGIVFHLLCNLSVTYECRVDFLYEYDRPYRDIHGCLEADEGNRRARFEDISCGFKNELALFTSRKGVSRCQRDLAPLGEPVSRIEAILASVRLNVVGMPCTNFVYPCRLVLADGDGRNLAAFAGFCMNRVREQADEENGIVVAKATVYEHGNMRKAERRVKELESQVANGKGDRSKEQELRMARETVGEMNRRIEEIGKRVMSRGGRHIIFESPPDVSWVVRRKERTERQAR